MAAGRWKGDGFNGTPIKMHSCYTSSLEGEWGFAQRCNHIFIFLNLKIKKKRNDNMCFHKRGELLPVWSPEGQV